MPLGCIEAAAHRSRHPAKIATTTLPDDILFLVDPHSAHTHSHSEGASRPSVRLAGRRLPYGSTLRAARVTGRTSIANCAKSDVEHRSSRTISGFCLGYCVSLVVKYTLKGLYPEVLCSTGGRITHFKIPVADIRIS